MSRVLARTCCVSVRRLRGHAARRLWRAPPDRGMVGAMPSNDERKARNETFFREINEGIEEVIEHSTTVRSGAVAFVCECAREECTQAIALTIDEYRRVRSL